MKCKAKSKRSGKRCRAYAIKGKDRCRMHGGTTPIKHGLFSKYPDAIVGGHMEAAKLVSQVQSLSETIPVLVAILSLWVERGIVFSPKHYLATCTLMGRLTTAVETYEKLTNPELRTRRMEHTGKDGGPIKLQNMTDDELEAELEQLREIEGEES